MLIKRQDGTVLGRYTLDKYGRRVLKFNPSFILAAGATWRYSNTYSEGWMNPDFTVNSWLGASQGSFSSVSSSLITRYYRFALPITMDLTGYSSFELAVKSTYGIIMYVNGEEIYRNNLPADATSTTYATAADGSFGWRRAFASRHLLTENTILAVEIHFLENHATFDDEFDAYLSLVYGGTHRMFDGTNTGTHQEDWTTEEGWNMWDDQRNNKWYMNGLPAENIYTFNNARAEYVNSYKMIWGTYSEARKPRSWKVEGSNDGSTWELLDYRSGISPGHFQSARVFRMSAVRKGYKQLKFTLLTTGGSEAEFADLSLYAEDLPLADYTVAYEKPYVFYSGQSVLISPLSTQFHSWSITPDLPSTLTFDSSCGMISGTAPGDEGTTVYTVTAKSYLTGDLDYSGALSLTIDSCFGSYRKLRIIRDNGAHRGTEYIHIKKDGAIVETFQPVDDTGSEASSSETTFYCLPAGKYELEFHSDFYPIWSAGSKITLASNSVSDTFTFMGAYSAAKDGEVIPISLGNVLSGDVSGWTYRADGVVPENWFSTDYSETWSELVTPVPSVSQSVWLLRRTVHVDSLVNINAYEIDLKVRSGVVLYVNGVEVYRVHVDGPVTASSTSSFSATSPSSHVFVGLVGTNYLHTGDNVLAVAVVNSGSDTVSLDFTATMYFRSEVSMFAHGTGLSISGDGSNVSNLFNGGSSNQWTATLSESGASFQFIWNTNAWRKQQINKFCMVPSADYPKRDIADFVVLTTPDGEEWTELTTYTNIRFGGRLDRKCFYLNNPTTIRGMRVHVMKAVEGSSVQLTLFDVMMENTDNIPETSLTYSSRFISAVKGAPIETIMPTSQAFMDYSITPDLPEGLVLG